MEGQVAVILVTQILRVLEDNFPGSLDQMIDALTPREGVIELSEFQTPAALLAPQMVALEILTGLRSQGRT